MTAHKHVCAHACRLARSHTHIYTNRCPCTHMYAHMHPCSHVCMLAHTWHERRPFCTAVLNGWMQQQQAHAESHLDRMTKKKVHVLSHGWQAMPRCLVLLSHWPFIFNFQQSCVVNLRYTPARPHARTHARLPAHTHARTGAYRRCLLPASGRAASHSRCAAQHAVPCHDITCHAMPCHAMPCHAMP